MGNRAKIASIYSIIEPIGVLAGTQRTVVRFGGRLPDYYSSQAKENDPKQIAVAEAVQEIGRCTSPKTRPQLTMVGGEPLFYADWITRLVKRMPDAEVLLRTDGTQPKALAQVLPFVHLISLQWELSALERLVSVRQNLGLSLQLIRLRCGEVVLRASREMITGDKQLLADYLETAAMLLSDRDDNSLPVWLAMPHEALNASGVEPNSLTAMLFASFPHGRVCFYH